MYKQVLCKVYCGTMRWSLAGLNDFGIFEYKDNVLLICATHFYHIPVYIYSVYSPFSDGFGLPLHNIPFQD